MKFVTRVLVGALCLIGLAFAPNHGWSQEPSEATTTQTDNTSGDQAALQPMAKVDVQPLARDSQIAERLESIRSASTAQPSCGANES